VWRLEDHLAPLLADCRRLLDAESRFLVLTVYAVRMSALAIGELLQQLTADLGGKVECGEMTVREESRGLLLPTAIFARWSRD
jgi:23S rRNA (cytosine1962-C5)-methyltransferase